MRFRNGKAPDTGDGVEGLRINRLASAVDFSNIQNSNATSIITAELSGDTCSAGDITASSAAPILLLCRKLVAAGLHPHRPMHCYRGSVLAVIVRSIGYGAKLAVKERAFGPVFEGYWAPPQTPPVAPPMRRRGYVRGKLVGAYR